MKVTVLLVPLVCFAALTVGCGSTDTVCETGDGCGPGGIGGSGGNDPGGGTGGKEGEAGAGGGQAGSGGDVPDMTWTEVKPDRCSDEQSRNAISMNLFQDVFQVGVFPTLPEGYSSSARVLGYENNMTVIRLATADSQFVRIQWPGVLGNYAVDSTVTLEQTRDWTIIRGANGRGLSAMFYRNGEVAGEKLDPLPAGGPSLRFAMQCNVQDDAFCTMNAVAALSGTGDTLKTFESGVIIHDGDWTISNRSAYQAASCTGSVRFLSLVWADKWP